MGSHSHGMGFQLAQSGETPRSCLRRLPRLTAATTNVIRTVRGWRLPFLPPRTPGPLFSGPCTPTACKPLRNLTQWRRRGGTSLSFAPRVAIKPPHVSRQRDRILASTGLGGRSVGIVDAAAAGPPTPARHLLKTAAPVMPCVLRPAPFGMPRHAPEKGPLASSRPGKRPPALLSIAYLLFLQQPGYNTCGNAYTPQPPAQCDARHVARSSVHAVHALALRLPLVGPYI